MAWTYEIVTPTPVANATVERGLSDGVHKIYRVRANDGYVLHDKRLDVEETDPNTLEPNGIITLGYSAGTKTVAASYDFTAITQGTIQGVSGNSYIVDKVGANEFYTMPEDEVPTAQIFGGGSDHEVM